MEILLVVWLAMTAGAVGILLGVTMLHRFEHIGEVAAALVLCAFPFSFVVFDNLFLLSLAVLAQLWLLVLPARLVFGRLEHQFLEHSTRANALFWVCILVVIALLQWWQPALLTRFAVAALLALCFAASIWSLGQQWWNTRRYKTRGEHKVALNNMPTVSVCIPARNEDHALAACLTAVLASDYPKLEVLVLDDCSQDSTSTIIKSFAHDGVRFIQGDTPAVGWLGKNQARQTLAAQASGEYLLFVDVDTLVAPHSISQLVQYLLDTRQQMVSVLPQNRLGVNTSTLFGTLNYLWRLIVPITKKHIPVSSSCWLVSVASLQHLGGFASSSRKIMPEESFARRLAQLKAYRFIAGDASLGITTGKRWSSQIETELRLNYPNLQRQPAKAMAAYVGVLGLGVGPFIIFGQRLFIGVFDVFFWMALVAIILLYINYLRALRRLQPHTWFLVGLLWPYAAAQEAMLFVLSMLQYEFGEVNWKGRNVCYPVVAISQLQKGDKKTPV